MQDTNGGKSAENEKGTAPNREHRTRTRRFLSPSRHPVLSGEKFSRILLIVLSIIFTLFVLCLTAYYIHFYFDFDMNFDCNRFCPSGKNSTTVTKR